MRPSKPSPSRLAATPEKTSCAKAQRLYDGYMAAKADGKKSYRNKKLSAWYAKWEGRLDDCANDEGDLDQAAVDLELALQANEDAENALLNPPSYLDVFRGENKWAWIGGVAAIFALIALVVLVALFPAPGPDAALEVA